MEISLYMSIFEPQAHFLLSLIVWVVLLVKITIIERKNIKNFLSTTLFGITFVLAAVLYLIPNLLSKEVYLGAELFLIGIVLGLIFTDLFIKPAPNQDKSQNDKETEENKYERAIEKRKRNIQKKLPLLFGIIGLSIQNNSGSPFLAPLVVLIVLCASLLYLSIKERFKISTNYLAGFTLTILFQFLITYNEFASSIIIQVIEMILWSLAVIFLYSFERKHKEESFDRSL